MSVKMISIKTKLLATLLVLSIVPFALIGVISLVNSGNALSSLAFDQLKSMREIKKRQIETYFNEHKNNMGLLLETVESLQRAAFAKLNSVQENKKAEIRAYFKKSIADITVIAKNYTIIRALNDFTSVFGAEGQFDGKLYDFFERVKYGDSLFQFKKEYGYHDLLLIDANGTVVFSINREADLGQNLNSGPLADSGLGRCYKKSGKSVYLQDFSPYPPSGGQSMAFLGSPITDRMGQVSGTVVLKLDSGVLNTIVHRREGMGKTGETYLLGKDNGQFSLRSDQLIKRGRVGQPVSDPHAAQAVNRQVGPVIKLGETGNMEIAYYDPMGIPGLDWVIVTTMGLEEAIAPSLGPEVDYFGKYVQTYGLADLLLITPDGYVFYSVAREKDYGSNVLEGQAQDEGLGRLVQKVLNSKKLEFVDFQLYSPVGGGPYSFIGQPVLRDGQIELIVTLRMPIKTINDIMLKRDGMGKTGETYLVGPDRLLRSDSYPSSELFTVQAAFADPKNRSLDTLSIRQSLAGATGEKIIFDYRGVEVLSAYTPLQVWDTNWALIAEMDTEEAFAGLQSFKVQAFGLASVFIIIIVLLSLFMARHFAKPVAELTKGARQLADRNFDVTVKVQSNDELEVLAGSFNSMAVEIKRYSKSLEQKVEQLKSAEAELRHNEIQLKQLADATWEAIVIHEYGLVLQANQQFYDMFGYQPDEVIGKDIIPLFVAEKSRGYIVQQMQNGSLGPYEATLVTKNKQEVPGEIRVRMMDYKNRRVRVAAIRDLSYRLAAEEEKAKLEHQLRQAQKMEALGTLAGGIAHDFNNILAAILGFSQLALDDTNEGENCGPHISEVITAAKRGRDLINQILSFSRKIEPQLKVLDLNQEIMRACDMLRSTLPKMIELNTDLDPGLYPVLGDPSMIAQVLINLGTNSADAMANDGKLLFKTRNYQLADGLGKQHVEMPPGDYVFMEVTDTGVGMDSRTQQQIFDPFFTTKEVGKGTGLGLSTVFGIIKGHSGHVYCYSEPGRGTSFNIYLPASQESDVDQPPEDSSADGKIQGGDETILLVDDEKVLRVMGHSILTKAGYEVLLAESGEMALDLYNNDPQGINLVLLDLSMPGMGGHKCLEELLRQNPLAKVVITSGYSAEGMANLSLKKGALAYIGKPFSVVELLSTVRNILDG